MRIWFRIHLALLLITPPLLIGGVHPQTQIFAAVLACLFLVLSVLRRLFKSDEKTTWGLSGWGWLGIAAIAMTGFQLVSLPPGLIAWLSPAADTTFRKLLTPMGLYNDQHWQALSLAPGDTAVKWLRDIGLLALYLGVFFYTRSRQHLRIIIRISVFGAVGLFSLTILQTILGIENPLMGLYALSAPSPGLLKGSPFVNFNHFGAYLAFHAVLCLYLIEDAEPGRERWMWLSTLGILSVGIIGSLSRGAILAYALGVIGFFIQYSRNAFGHLSKEELAAQARKPYKRHRGKRSTRDLRPPWQGWKKLWGIPALRYTVIVFLLVAGFALHWAGNSLYETFHTSKESLKQEKHVAIYQVAAPLMRHYPLTGVGRGATGIAWTQYTNPSTLAKGQITPTHVESQLLQPFVDWGWLFGLAFLLAVGWLFWQMYRRSEGLLEQSCLLAIGVLCLQNAVDFNLEFVGTTFPMVAVLAALASLQFRRNTEATDSKWPAFASLGIGVFGLIAVAAVGPFALNHNVNQVQRQWAEIEQTGANQFNAAAKAFLKQHPADFTVPLYAAQFLLKQKQPPFKEILQWLDRARFLNPTSAGRFLLTARTYAELGLPKQAVYELGRVVALHSPYRKQAHIIAKHYKLLALLLRSTKDEGQANLSAASWLASKPPAKERSAMMDMLLQRFPKGLGIYYITLRDAMQQYRTAYRSKDETAASKRKRLLARTTACAQQIPRCKGIAFMFKGHIATTENRLATAISFYQKAKSVSRITAWESTHSLIIARLRAKQPNKALEEIRAARGVFHRFQRLAALFGLEAQTHLQRKAYKKAQAALEEAVTLGDNSQYWSMLAKVCWERGNAKRAIRIMQRLVKNPKNKHNKQFKARLERWRLKYQKRQQISPLR